jgi:Orthopoxvirus protein of unknown function (DUF830).
MACRSAQIKILLISFGVCILALSCNHTPFFIPDISQLHNGDIILRKGRGVISDLIVSSINDTLPYSHCGILVKENNEWKVIHSLARELSEIDGIQQCSLDNFLADCDDSCLMVVRCKKSKADSLITDAARYYLKRKIPFDYQFSLADSSAFFCSELPLHILKYRCNISFNTKEKYIPFSIFTDTTYFRVIARRY